MAANVVDKSLLAKFGVNELKQDQTEIFNCLMSGRDCFVVQPTGFGKSLPFQLYTAAQKTYPEYQNIDVSQRPKVLVCSPLISLMKDQVKKLSTIEGLSARYKGESEAVDMQIRNGEIDLIYASPEVMVGDQDWRQVFHNLNVKLIVIDEFHTIYTWGLDKDKKEAFRGWFGSIGEIRSIFPNAVLLALSAICTLKMKVKIMKMLKFINPKEICHSPDKPNIKSVVKKVPKAVQMALTWIVDGLTFKQKDFPKCIIYCNTIKDASAIYQYINTKCPHLQNSVAMFHSETSNANKNNIVSEIGDENCNLKIVIANSALGMDIDLKWFYSVILYGLPQPSVELVQEIGRIGRDQKPSVAIMYNSYNAIFVNGDINNLVNTKICRRTSLMQCFLNEMELQTLSENVSGFHTSLC